MAKEGKLQKVIPVFKTIFPLIGKKYPAFFFIKILDMIFSTIKPFIGLFITPLIIDELISISIITIYSYWCLFRFYSLACYNFMPQQNYEI